MEVAMFCVLRCLTSRGMAHEKEQWFGQKMYTGLKYSRKSRCMTRQGRLEDAGMPAHHCGLEVWSDGEEIGSRVAKELEMELTAESDVELGGPREEAG